MIKLVIWDLDNTIWDGIWLEEKTNIKLKPQILDLIKYLDSKGIVQTIVSKNDESEELEKFLTDEEILEYLIYSRINWSPKSQNVFNIKNIFNISKWEDILFIDDEAFEREEVKYNFPDIRVLDSKEYLSLFTLPEIADIVSTEVDTKRKQLYKDNLKREELAQTYHSDYQKFLVSLEMQATIRKALPVDIPRIYQLLYRTNQWNSAVHVYDEKELAVLLDNTYVLELYDKIGDYGLIGVKIEKYDLINQIVLIDTMTLSCRIAGRGLGTVLVIDTINRQPIDKTIRVEFVETKYNTKLHELYNFLNFTHLEQNDNIHRYEYVKTDKKLVYPSWISITDTSLDITLHLATSEDYPKLCELAKKDKNIRAFPGMSYRWGWKDKITVATINQEIVGFHYYNVCKLKPWSNSYFIYTAPQYRKRGIASVLFHDFIRLSKDKRSIKWLVSPKNDMSFQFYKQNGVLPKGKKKGYLEYEVEIAKFNCLI